MDIQAHIILFISPFFYISGAMMPYRTCIKL